MHIIGFNMYLYIYMMNLFHILIGNVVHVNVHEY